MPNEPLIGNKKLGVITTDWSNIDVASFENHRELNAAYQKTLQGETTELQLGPHFFDLESAEDILRESFPMIAVSPSRRISLKDLLTDSRLFRQYGNFANSRYAARLGNEWMQLYDELEKLSYQSEVITLRRKIKDAVNGLKRMKESNKIFNSTGASDIRGLVD